MLKGSLVALVTPFYFDGGVDYDTLGGLIEYHLQSNTDGFVILGTTGEAATMSFEERLEVVKFSARVIKKRVPLIIGAGSNDTNQALKNAYEFSRAGADYLLVVTPYYNKTNDNGLIRHYEKIASVSACPIILYNVPSRTGMNISINVIEKLSRNKNIIGIKEASGNMSYSMKVAQYLSDDFLMFAGNDDIIVPMMSIGCSGVISVLANIAPTQVHNMCMHCLNNEYDKAIKINNELLDVANGLFIDTNPIPVKEAMNLLGYGVGGLRLPLYPMEFADKEKLVSILNAKKDVIF